MKKTLFDDAHQNTHQNTHQNDPKEQALKFLNAKFHGLELSVKEYGVKNFELLAALYIILQGKELMQLLEAHRINIDTANIQSVLSQLNARIDQLTAAAQLNFEDVDVSAFQKYNLQLPSDLSDLSDLSE